MIKKILFTLFHLKINSCHISIDKEKKKIVMTLNYLKYINNKHVQKDNKLCIFLFDNWLLE